jgi:hypothetical protein
MSRSKHRPQEPGVTPQLLLDVFDLPISFHRCLVPLTGSVTAALMLSQAICTTHDLDPGAYGWFQKSQEEWAGETGLTRWEQETARRSLREAGFLMERRAGMPARLWFRVCSQVVWEALKAQAARNAAQRGAWRGDEHVDRSIPDA